MDSAAFNGVNSTTNKFVRLIVANDSKTNKQHITAMKPMSSNSSIERMDIKLAAEKMLKNEREVSLPKVCSGFKEEIEAKITETVK